MEISHSFCHCTCYPSYSIPSLLHSYFVVVHGPTDRLEMQLRDSESCRNFSNGDDRIAPPRPSRLFLSFSLSLPIHRHVSQRPSINCSPGRTARQCTRIPVRPSPSIHQHSAAGAKEQELEEPGRASRSCRCDNILLQHHRHLRF